MSKYMHFSNTYFLQNRSHYLLHSRIHEKRARLAEVHMQRQAQELHEEELELDSQLAALSPKKRRK